MSHPYCAYVSKITDKEDVDKIYHDLHYGVRIEDDNELFCRLVMEINQAGLSWHTILVKEKNFRKAYHNFDIKKVANYKEKDFERLMQDAGIIRNRLKINAAIYNAQQIKLLQKEFGSFRKWLDTQNRVIIENVLISIVSSSNQQTSCLGPATTRDPVSLNNTNLDSRSAGNLQTPVDGLRGNDNTEAVKHEIKKSWLKLFKKHFKFVGGEIVGEFLMSIDMLPGSHGQGCFKYDTK